MKRNLFAVFVTSLALSMSAPAQDAPAGGAVDPKNEAGAGKSQAAPGNDSLLSSTDAEVAATYRCASSDRHRVEDRRADLLTAKGILDNNRNTLSQMKRLAEATPGPEANKQVKSAQDVLVRQETLVRELEQLVGTFKEPPPCPLTKELNTKLSRLFRQPLRLADGRPTELSTILVEILKSTYAEEPIAAPDAQYILIHLVDRQGAAGIARSQQGEPAAKPGTAPSIFADRWILAHRTSKGISLSESRRIFGARTIGLLFIHLNAITGATEPAEVRYGDVHYRVVIEPKLAANVERLLSVFKLAGALQTKASSAEERTVGYMGFGLLHNVAVPSDVSVFGVAPNGSAAPSLIATPRKYDNEGKSLWDISVAVPLNKISLVEYSEENRTYFPKQINKQSVYALFNIYPWPVDIKNGTLRYILPRAIAGLGLTGRPGETFLVGGSWGFRELQFFVGSGFANHRTLTSGADPSNPLSYQQRYSSRLTYGLNIPVAAAIKKVKDSAKSKQ